MANFNFSKNDLLEELGRDLIAEHHPHLNELGVDVRLRLYSKPANLQAQGAWGETRLMNNAAAYYSNEYAAVDRKLNPPDFPCISCYRWQPKDRRVEVTIGTETHLFCPDCQSDPKTNPVFARPATELDIKRMKKRQERVDTMLAAGPPEYEAFFSVAICLDVWRDAGNEERVWLLDHYLSMCGASRKKNSHEIKLAILIPSIKVFPDVIKRHGWASAPAHVRGFGKIAKEADSQLGLPFERGDHLEYDAAPKNGAQAPDTAAKGGRKAKVTS